MTLKATDNPPPLFPSGVLEQAVAAGQGKAVWWVARTRARQEKALAWSLKSMGVGYFLPLVSRPQKSKEKRMRTAVVPLFNGYLFFRGDLAARQQALRTGRVAQVLAVGEQERLVTELAALARATSQRCGLELCDFITRGQRVRIVAGPLEGLTGIVRRYRNKTRLVLQVEAIRQAAAVEIDLDQVRPV